MAVQVIAAIAIAALSYYSGEDVHGPRIEGGDLKPQFSSYGAPIPIPYGSERLNGNVIWMQELQEHQNSQSAKGGPDVTTYTYTLNCAVGICVGPIAGVLRIWANKKIVYDVRPGVTQTRAPELSGLRIYLGTEEQEPDPLIESIEGPWTAYRGLAYVVFEDYDATETRGRIQFEFEVVTHANHQAQPVVSYAENTISADRDPETGYVWLNTTTGHAVYDGSSATWSLEPGIAGRPQIQVWNPLTHELVNAYDIGADDTGTYPIDGQLVYGAALETATGEIVGGRFFVGRGAPGSSWAGPTAATTPYAAGMMFDPSSGSARYLTIANNQDCTQHAFYWPTVPDVSLFGPTQDFFIAPSSGVAQTVGTRFYADGREAVIDSAICNEFTGAHPPLFPAVYPSPIYKNTPSPFGAILQGDNGIVILGTTINTIPGTWPVGVIPPLIIDPVNQVAWTFDPSGKQLYKLPYVENVSPRGPSLPNNYTIINGAYDIGTDALRLLVQTNSGEKHVILLDPITGELKDDVLVSGFIGSSNGTFGWGKVWNDEDRGMLIVAQGSLGLVNIPYRAQLSGQGILLMDIVRDVCLRSGLTDDDINVDELTDIVDGYVLPRQMSGRSAIEPLQQAYFFDGVESDDVIKYVKRGHNIAATIPMDDRAAHEAGQDMPDHLKIVRANELELPVHVDVEYSDKDADYLVGSQYARRTTKDSKAVANLQLPIVMNNEKALQVALTNLYQAWLGQRYQWATTRKYAHLEPTDVVALPTTAVNYVARITSKRELPPGIIEWEGLMEDQAVYQQSGKGASVTSYTPQEIIVPADTVLELIDAPLLRDQDEGAGFYVAATGAVQ